MRKTSFRTLDQWPDKWLPSDGYVIVAPTMSLFQTFSDKKRDKVLTSSISRRGAIPDQDPRTKTSERNGRLIFDVATAPKRKSEIRTGLINVIREKAINDITAANGLLKQLGIKGEIGADEVLTKRKGAKVIAKRGKP